MLLVVEVASVEVGLEVEEFGAEKLERDDEGVVEAMEAATVLCSE